MFYKLQHDMMAAAVLSSSYMLRPLSLEVGHKNQYSLNYHDFTARALARSTLARGHAGFPGAAKPQR